MTAAAALGRLARDVARFADDWPRQGAEVAAGVLRGQLAADGGGTFSKAPGMSARVEVRPGSGSAEAVGVGGGWTWLQHGTRPHTVNAKAGGFLRTPYGPRRRVDDHGDGGEGDMDEGCRPGRRRRRAVTPPPQFSKAVG